MEGEAFKTTRKEFTENTKQEKQIKVSKVVPLMLFRSIQLIGIVTVVDAVNTEYMLELIMASYILAHFGPYINH